MASTFASGLPPPAAAASLVMRAVSLVITWVATEERIARPSAPPTCCIVLRTPEPMPESSGRRWCTAVRVTVTKVMPMPIDISSIHGNRWVQ